MSALRCRIFGHKTIPPGWWGDIPYVDIKQGATDHIGRIHGRLYHECHRCGQRYMVGRIHLNHPVILASLADHIPEQDEGRG